MKISYDDMKAALDRILEAAGESAENSAAASEIMVLCDARGISTHGSHMCRLVYDRAKEGRVSLPTEIRTLSEKGAAALLDGCNGMGQIAGVRAAKTAVRLAEQNGIGAVLVRNTNNVGALGYYADLIAEQKMIGLISCNASPAMAPWGAAEQFFGTQPFAISLYGGGKYVFSADMATAVAARGKIRKAAREGKPIPEGWALDREGNPTTDPAAALKGVVLPIGGAKGSAIAFAIDIAAGLLSGSSYAPNVRAIHNPEGAAGVGLLVIALDIAAFMPIDEYERKITAYFASAKNLKKAAGTDEITLPGERRHRTGEAAVRNGIEAAKETVGELNEILAAEGAPLLSPMPEKKAD